MDKEAVLDLLNKIRHWTELKSREDFPIEFCMQNIKELSYEIETQIIID